jgi:hypothetical protein
MSSEKLWQVWWLWGIPVAWATSALVLAAEFARNAGNETWGSALDVLRLGLYWWWMRMAWSCSRHVRPLWALLARLALVLGLAAHAFV